MHLIVTRGTCNVNNKLSDLFDIGFLAAGRNSLAPKRRINYILVKKRNIHNLSDPIHIQYRRINCAKKYPFSLSIKSTKRGMQFLQNGYALNYCAYVSAYV